MPPLLKRIASRKFCEEASQICFGTVKIEILTNNVMASV